MPSSRAPFVIDRDALDRARLHLGLRHPVQARITYYSRDRSLHGRYVDLQDGVHRIALSGEQGWRSASRTLWHELGHALQVERLGSRKAFDEQIDREMKAAGISLPKGVKWWQARRYRETDLEVEAEDVARRHARPWRLCRPRNR